MSTQPATPDRIDAILASLLAHTAADNLRWERAAIIDSYAISIGNVRFRVRSEQGAGAAPYVIEFLGTAVPPPRVAAEGIVRDLYVAARDSATEGEPDPFISVEEALGINPVSSESAA